MTDAPEVTEPVADPAEATPAEETTTGSPAEAPESDANASL